MAHVDGGNIDEILNLSDRAFQQTEIKAELPPAKPPSVEHDDTYDYPEPEVIPAVESEVLGSQQKGEDSTEINNDELSPTEEQESDIDDYGNPKPQQRTYSQEEADEYANRIVRERIARMERNQPKQELPQYPQNPQYPQQQEGQSDENWQNELEKFVENVALKREQKAAQQAFQQREQQIQAEFESKFQADRGKFQDFDSVVGAQPITEVMVGALRAFDKPGAFIYAACKRMPAEVQRIANIQDPYRQIAEMGKLEERMRKPTKTPTNAPRPMTKTPEDMVRAPKKKDTKERTIEDLIHQDAQRKMQMMRNRRGR